MNSERLYNNLEPKPNISRDVTLRSYDKKVIPSLGMCIAKLLVNNSLHNTLFAVVKNDCQSILGLCSSLRFGFIYVPNKENVDSQELSLDVQVITTQTVSHPDSQSDMKGKYPSVFDGLGKFPEPYKIKLKV